MRVKKKKRSANLTYEKPLDCRHALWHTQTQLQFNHGSHRVSGSDGTLPVALGRVVVLAACADCALDSRSAGEAPKNSWGVAM